MKTVKKTDNRVKVLKKTAAAMTRSVNAGKSLTSIAEKYGVSVYAVKYNTDPEFKAAEQERKRLY